MKIGTMQSKVLIKSLIVNALLSIIKFIGSILSNSKTLLGDAIHCISDMSTDLIGLIGTKLSSKKPDENHPFGHGKIEYLTSILMSLFIVSLGISTIISAINGEIKNTNIYALVVIVISIIIKYILSEYILKKGKELNSNILLANGTESKYDTYNSIIALIFIIISLFGFKNKIFTYADIIGSLVMSALTIKIGVEIFLENISSVLGEVENNPEVINEITKIIKQTKNIKVRRITLLKYGSYYSATIELILDGKLTLNEIYEIEKKIKSDLKTSKLNIRYVTVNFKPKK